MARGGADLAGLVAERGGAAALAVGRFLPDLTHKQSLPFRPLGLEF